MQQQKLSDNFWPREESGIWKAAKNRKEENCICNYAGDRKTGRFVTADGGKSVTAHEVINRNTATKISKTYTTNYLMKHSPGTMRSRAEMTA